MKITKKLTFASFNVFKFCSPSFLAASNLFVNSVDCKYMKVLNYKMKQS